MKQLWFTLALVLIGSVAFTQSQKTFVKSFNLEGNHAVVLNLDGKVEVKEWSDKLVRVLTNIEVENSTDATLKALIAAGRYKLVSSKEGGALMLTSTSRAKEVKLRGQVLVEHVTYTVYVPSNVNVEVTSNGAQTSLEFKEKTSSLK
ncbi:MAG: hypothetical protein AAF502_18575 [Bacteroidota bacterium]